MSYNWIDAATPQGRERLQELMDTGETVPCKWKSKRNEKIPVRFLFAVKKENRYYLGASESTNRVDESFVNGVEFLDPDPRQPEPLDIDQMRGYCIKWCEGLGLEIEEDAYPCNKLWVKKISLKCWEIRYVSESGHHNLLCRLSEFVGEYATVITYSIIRVVERDEIRTNE